MPASPFRRPTRTITETVHGVDVSYTVPDNTPVIRLPFNLDAALRRALFTLAVTMTVGAIIWGTVAIGSMLAMLAPAWAAYLVAGVFDAGWAACLIAEWILRYDSKRAEAPRNAGVAMLAVSMAAIITHGALAGPWGWIVGIVGALVSAAAKGVWAIGMHTIRIKLSPKYEAYLDARRQQTGTEMALALGERDRLVTSDRAARLRLALEARRPNAPVIEPAAAVEADAIPAAIPLVRGPKLTEPAGPVGEEIEDLTELLAAAHPPVVYFLRNGNRVKIGTTRNLRRRIAGLALRPDDAVRVEHGGVDYEQSLHARFDAHRVGNTEWFELRDDLAAYLGMPEQIAITPEPARELFANTREQDRQQIPNEATARENTDREQPSIADLAREQVAITANNPAAVEAILRARPEASKPSVAAAVRRARKAAQGPYL